MATMNIASNDPDYFSFVSSLLGDFNKIEALLCGVNAIVDRQRDDSNLDDVYASELLHIVSVQLAAMREKIDESTFGYVQKAA